jgi:hypothetical protein
MRGAQGMRRFRFERPNPSFHRTLRDEAAHRR